MTVQKGDIYKYENKEYSIVAMSVPIKFRPQDYGLNPQSRCTACWKGYWCEYHIIDDMLLLENFFMFNRDGNYPLFNGIGVVKQTYHEATSYRLYDKKSEKIMIEDNMGHRKYRGVNLPIKYTGKILVGDGFIRDYYILMEYQWAWAYKTLIEFVFKDGRLIETTDHSDMAERMRSDIKTYSKTIAEVRKNVSLDMKNKAWWINR